MQVLHISASYRMQIKAISCVDKDGVNRLPLDIMVRISMPEWCAYWCKRYSDDGDMPAISAAKRRWKTVSSRQKPGIKERYVQLLRSTIADVKSFTGRTAKVGSAVKRAGWRDVALVLSDLHPDGVADGQEYTYDTQRFAGQLKKWVKYSLRK